MQKKKRIKKKIQRAQACRSCDSSYRKCKYQKEQNETQGDPTLSEG